MLLWRLKPAASLSPTLRWGRAAEPDAAGGDDGGDDGGDGVVVFVSPLCTVCTRAAVPEKLLTKPETGQNPKTRRV